MATFNGDDGHFGGVYAQLESMNPNVSPATMEELIAGVHDLISKYNDFRYVAQMAISFD